MFFGSKKCLGQKNFCVKHFFGSKILGQKTFQVEGKNNLASKKYWGQKELGPKKMLSKKRQVGLTQGEGYMAPPPENSRVKILLGCSELSKKIFCKEKKYWQD